MTLALTYNGGKILHVWRAWGGGGKEYEHVYADGGLLGSQDLEWLQEDINVLIGIFCRVVLMANIAKSNTMTYQPGEICTGMSEDAFSQRSTGRGGA